MNYKSKIILLTIFCYSVQSQETVSVRVDQTEVIGTVEGRRGQREYYAFKGIEYAKAKRWEDPVMLEMLEQEYNATNFGSVCPQQTWNAAGQNILVGNEECLFLNIYTRVLPSNTGTGSGNENLNPVMVYIHGGGFKSGDGEVAGPRFFMTASEKVVLVAINYRLGVLGFLSTGDKDLPGNWGNLDQVKALEWIQRYIKYFGGDPNRVTIFGHSGGAASVHYLTLSPLATGKFQKAIIISGNALCGNNIQTNPLSYANKVARLVSCSTDSISGMVDCLKNQSAASLIKAQEDLIDFWIYPKHAVPVVDGHSRESGESFLPNSPSELIDSGKFEPIPMMTGVMLDEGFGGYTLIHNKVGNTNFRNTTYFVQELIPRILRGLRRIDNESDTSIKLLTDLVLENYFHQVNMTDETSLKSAITEMTGLLGDVIYNSCQHDFLERYAYQARAPVYSFVFTHKTPSSPRVNANDIDKLRKYNISSHLFDFGVPHGHDMFYLFDPLGYYTGREQPVLSAIDKQVAASYVKYFIAFAKNGSPSEGLDPIKEIWRPIKQGTLNYFNVTSSPVLMGEDFRMRESLFWLRTVPYVTKVEANITADERKLQKTEDALNTFMTLFWIAIVLAIILLCAVIALGFVLWRKRTTGNATLH